jgi:hypothetical protein
LTRGFNLQTNKIFTFGDGFATGHIWPEWPQILQALLPDYQVINTAGIGAGAEFLVSGFVDCIPDMHGSTVIFQWPQHQRFDKLVEDDSWQHIITNDPVYYFNTVADCGDRKWWLSSASKMQEIKDYHNRFVQSSQHIHRQNVYKALITQTAENLNCRLIHTETELENRFSHEERFKLIRQTEVQPSPIVHFYWLIEKIIPQLGVKVDAELKKQLELLVTQTRWVPYDPDREEIWLKIKEQLGKN